MKNKRIILPEKRYEKAPTEDMSLSVKLQGKRKLLTNDERDTVLNVAKLFDEERQDSDIYKIHGKIKMIFRNMYSGWTSYRPLNDKLYILDDGSSYRFYGYMPYDEFAFLRKDVLREEPVVPTLDEIGLSTFDGFNTTIVGDTTHNTITSLDSSKFNWNLYLSYIDSQDTGHTMTYTLSDETSLSFVSEDGIPFRVNYIKPYYRLISPVEHGMNQGEYIIIDDYPYYVNLLGNENYNSEKYVINILKSQVPVGETGLTSNVIVTGKRCTDKNNLTGTTSQYYVHKHKTLTDVDGYILDKAGFESPIWEDEKKLVFENIYGDNNVLVERNRMESLLYDFKEPFVLTGLTNNLGYLPTEVYVSVILRNSNGYFEYPPKVGYSFNFHDTYVDDHFDGSNSQETTLVGTTFYREADGDPYWFTSGSSVPIGTELTGAFIEYNPIEMKERIISESIYKFYTNIDNFDYGQTGYTSTFTGATLTNPFGYFYQPHYRVKLRELSPYVETSDVYEIENLPQNAKYFGVDGLWKWRDLYKHGYTDDLGNGTDYPFINNIHYIKNDINFYLKNEQIYQNKPTDLSDFNSSNKINC